MAKHKGNCKGHTKVTTKAGRLIGYYCSYEEAEYIAEKGRGRIVWDWHNESWYSSKEVGYYIYRTFD